MARHRGNAQDNTDDTADHGWSTKTRIILAVVGIAAFAGLYLIAVTLLPRVWTNFITGMTNESVLTSWLLGLLIGFAFALLPILVFLMGMRLRRSWKGVIGWLIAAIACALPNIITIAVSTGETRAETAAANDMLLKAPGFITASYIGIAIGVGVGLWVAWITYSRRRAQRKAEELKAKKEQEANDDAETTRASVEASSGSTADAPQTGSAQDARSGKDQQTTTIDDTDGGEPSSGSDDQGGTTYSAAGSSESNTYGTDTHDPSSHDAGSPTNDPSGGAETNHDASADD